MNLDFYFGLAAGFGFGLLAWLAVALLKARRDEKIEEWAEDFYAPPRVEPPEFRPGYRPPPVVTRLTNRERTTEI